MSNHPAPALAVSDSDREALTALVRAGTSEQRAVMRARVVLRAAEGVANTHIGAELGVAPMTVQLWRRRYAEAGLAGLVDAPRPGHPPTYGRENPCAACERQQRRCREMNHLAGGSVGEEFEAPLDGREHSLLGARPRHRIERPFVCRLA